MPLRNAAAPTAVAVSLLLLVVSAGCSRSKGPANDSGCGEPGGACSPEGASCSPAPIGTGWSHALSCQGGTWQELEIAPLPTTPPPPPPLPSGSSSVGGGVPLLPDNPDAARPERVWEARRGGQRVLRISDRPGPIVDSNAPPPPPGQRAPSSAFLSASCTGDMIVCSRAGTLLRASQSLAEFLGKLTVDGFDVKELPPGTP